MERRKRIRVKGKERRGELGRVEREKEEMEAAGLEINVNSMLFEKICAQNGLRNVCLKKFVVKI